MALAGFAFADVIVGTGESSWGYPFGSTRSYMRSASLYTAAEIQASGTITHLAWDVAVAHDTDIPIKIYITTTTASELTASTWASLTASLTPVFEDTVEFSDYGWYTLDIDDFDFNSGNLLVLCESNIVTTSYNNPMFRYTEVENMHQLWRDHNEPPQGVGYVETNRPNIKLMGITAPPSPATNPFPAHNAIKVLENQNLSWSASSLATNYKLYFGTDGAGITVPTNILNGVDLGNITYYYPSPHMDVSTTYYWQIVPESVDGLASGCPIWSFTTKDPPVKALPYFEDFDGTEYANAIDWLGYMNIYSNHGIDGSNAYSGNLFEYQTNLNAFSPQIGPMIPNAELKFDYRFVNETDYPNSAKELVETERLEVRITANGSTQTLLHTIDHTNHTPSTDFTTVTLSLSDYSDGYIEFEFYANRAEGSYYFDLDNFMVQEAPMPIFNITPDVTTFNFDPVLVGESALQSFRVSNSGDAPLVFDYINVTGAAFSEDSPFDASSIPAGESRDFTVSFAPTADIAYFGELKFDYGIGQKTIVLSGSGLDYTIRAANLPYITSFEAEWVGSPAAPLPGWKVIDANADGHTWRRLASSTAMPAHTGSYIAGGHGNRDDWMITPPIQTGVNLILKWYDRVEHSIYPNSYKVLYSTTDDQPASFTNELANFNCNWTNWTEHSLIIPNTTGTIFIAFYQNGSSSSAYQFGIDDLSLQELPNTPNLSFAPEYINFGAGYVNDAMGYQNVSISNQGAGVLNLNAGSISILGSDAGMFEFDPSHLPFHLEYGQIGVIPVRYNPTAIASHSAILRIMYDGTPFDVNLSGKAVGENALYESFEGSTFPPRAWTRSAGSTQWTQSTSQSIYGAKSMQIQTSTANTARIYTPLLDIENQASLNFWIRASNTHQSIQIQYSADATTWIDIADAVTVSAADTWKNVDIDLASLAGEQHYLAFFSPVQTNAGYVFVDMVAGSDIVPTLPGPVVLSSPAANVTNQSPLPSFSWYAPITGGIPTIYNIYCDENNPPTTLIGTSTSLAFTATTALPYNSTLYWTVAAENTAGEGAKAMARKMSTMADPTIYDLPWLEEFTASTFPPTNWSRYTGLYDVEPLSSTTAGWTRGNFGNDSSMGYSSRINITGSYTKFWLFTPPIMIPTADYQLKFDIALTQSGTSNPVNPGAQADDRFIVFVADNPEMVDATILRLWDNAASEYIFDEISNSQESHTLDLSSQIGTKYIAFYAESTIYNGNNTLHLDNVQVSEKLNPPIFSYTPSEMDFGDVFYNTPSEAIELTISNIGDGILELGTSELSILGPNAAEYGFDDSLLPASLAAGESINIPVRVTGTSKGDISATLRISYGGEDYDVALRANVPIIIGTGDIANAHPFRADLGFSRSASLFKAAEIGLMRVLNELSWNLYSSSDISIPYKIWAKNTNDSALIQSTWDEISKDMTLVKDGNITFDSTGWASFSLDNPMLYTGSNLIIAVETNCGGTGFGSGHTFYNSPISTDQHMIWEQNYSAPDSKGELMDFRPNIMLRVSEPPAGTPAEPMLIYPADESVNLPKNGFKLVWNADIINGGTPQSYTIYLANSKESLYSQHSWESSNTFFDPVLEGGISFDYSQSWYWTVKAINDDGQETALPFAFEIENDPTISSFPWLEDFEASSFPPHGWTRYNLDGYDPEWEYSSQNHSVAGEKAAAHLFSEINVNPEDGWLISPPIELDNQSRMLSFWSYNNSPEDYGYNGVWLTSGNPDPAIGPWQEIWNPDSVTDSWVQTQLLLRDYADQTIHIAFVYRGLQAHQWHLDDVSISKAYDVFAGSDPVALPGYESIRVQSLGGHMNFDLDVEFEDLDLEDIPNPNLTEENTFTIGFSGTGVMDIIFTFSEPGTWYAMLYRSGAWYQGDPMGIIIPSLSDNSISFKDVDFDAKGKIKLIFNKDLNPTLPVELSSFTAILTAEMYVKVAWVAESETNHSGYNIYRATEKDLSSAIKINPALITDGNSLGTQISYIYIDAEAYRNMNYYYWLQSVSLDGVAEYYGPLSIMIGDLGQEPIPPAIPLITQLKDAYPNPFNPSTYIPYSIKEAGKVDIKIYNMKGQLIKSLSAQHANPGHYQLYWDGLDMYQNPVSSGVYMYRMSSGKYHNTKKMILMK